MNIACTPNIQEVMLKYVSTFDSQHSQSVAEQADLFMLTVNSDILTPSNYSWCAYLKIKELQVVQKFNGVWFTLWPYFYLKYEVPIVVNRN